MWEAMADTYPFIHEIFVTISHDDGSVVGSGCDDQTNSSSNSPWI